MPPPPATEPLRALAPAKVNLTLRVTGRRADGYHLLDSLAVFAALGDRIAVRPAAALSLRVGGPFADGVPTGPENLVMRAAERLRALRRVGAGAEIALEKHLPHGGGIGGGSSDAATALGLLARLWGVAPLSDEEALPLGADVPVCLHAPRAARMEGIGERVTALPGLPPAALVLVSPGLHVPTPRVFEALRTGGTAFSAPLNPPGAPMDLAALAAFARRGGNDLQAAAVAVAPGIGAVLGALTGAPGLLAHGMSGSGSVCWGLAPDMAAARAAAAALRRPGWWVRAAQVFS